VDTVSADPEFVDTNDAYAVIDFAYRLLRERSIAPTDEAVRTVTRAVARYKGPRLVNAAVLTRFVDDTDGPSS